MLPDPITRFDTVGRVSTDQRAGVGGEYHDRRLEAWGKTSRSAAVRFRWLLLGTAGLIGFVLGLVGLHRYYESKADFGDLVYLDLKMLAFGGAPAPPPALPWQLQVARYVLPLVVLSGALAGLLALFRDRYEQARLPFVRGHVLVAGLGDKGLSFVQAMRAHGARVVAIESDAGNPNIAGARDAGATVLGGDATDERVLALAGVRRARYLLATASDAANVEVALQAERLVRGRRGASRLDCLAHVVDPDLCLLLKLQALTAARGGRFFVDFFNFYQQAARIACDRTLTPEGHVILVGDSPMIEHIALRVAADRSVTEPIDARQLTVVHPDAESLVQKLTALHPQIEGTCTALALDVQLDGPMVRKARLLPIGGKPALVYVCATDDAVGVEIALTLKRDARATGSHIVVCAGRSDGLASALTGASEGSPLEPITVLALVRETCTSDLVSQGIYETLGRAIHDDYVRSRRREQGSRPDDPALLPWNDLPPALKDSNRAQAAHIGVKLRAIGCELVPIDAFEDSDFAFTQAEVERLAQMEHERWVDERQSAGWRLGARRDPRERTTPYLVPWDELTEEIKDRDRETVHRIPELATLAGFRVERFAPEEPR